MNDTKKPYMGYHHPAEIINHAVWLYFRFTLSFHDVEELLVARGLIVTYETVRQWCLKFGQDFANEWRLRAPRRGDTWHLDEVYLRRYLETLGPRQSVSHQFDHRQMALLHSSITH